MEDVIRTAKEVKIAKMAFFLLSLTSISNQVRRLIRGSSVTSCASSELVPLQEDRSFNDRHKCVGEFGFLLSWKYMQGGSQSFGPFWATLSNPE